MKQAPTLWFVLACLLLQSVLWVLPAQRADAAEQLAHELVHAIDHGQHGLDSHGHHIDPTLALDEEAPVPGHSHANEGVQLQALMPIAGPAQPLLPRAAPLVLTPLAPLSALPIGLLRPPCARA